MGIWGSLWPLLSVGKGAPLRGVCLHSTKIIRLLFGPPEAQGAWLGGGVPFCGASCFPKRGKVVRKRCFRGGGGRNSGARYLASVNFAASSGPLHGAGAAEAP